MVSVSKVTLCLVALLCVMLAAASSGPSQRNDVSRRIRHLLQDEEPTPDTEQNGDEEPAAEEGDGDGDGDGDEAATEDAGDGDGDGDDAATEDGDGEGEPENGDGDDASNDLADLAALDPEVESTTTVGVTYIAVCPIDLNGTNSEGEAMSTYLKSMVNPCTANEETTTDAEQTKSFCNNCVRPLQTFLAREFHLSDLLREADASWDASDTAIHEQCAMDATTFLNETGMPYNDFFHTAVLNCQNYAEDSMCTIPTAELIEKDAIKAAIDNCQTNSGALTLGTNGTDTTAGGVDEEHPFCTDCYWPFFEAIIKETMSDEFMCAIKDAEEMSDIEIEAKVLEDPHMFACLLNIEGYLRENDMQTATIGYSDMEAVCFNDLNRPQTNSTQPMVMHWMNDPEMQTKVAATECA